MPLCTSEIEFELIEYIQDFKLEDDAEVYPTPSQRRPSRSVGLKQLLWWLGGQSSGAEADEKTDTH